MDIGLLLGFEDSITTITDLASEGESAGCASMYTVEAGRNAITCAAAVIAATERVRVGTYIVNAYARSPWLAGLAARDLDEMSGGRFVLGVGTGNPLFNDLYMGEDSSKPLAKMRDYIEIVRAVVAGLPDCNLNDVPDSCDIQNGASADLDTNGTPDECEHPGIVFVPDQFPTIQAALDVVAPGWSIREVIPRPVAVTPEESRQTWIAFLSELLPRKVPGH